MPQNTQTAPAPQAAKPKPPEPPPQFQERDIAKMDSAGLLAILKNSQSAEFQKAKACQRLGELAAKEAVPALSALLSDEHLSVYARYGLEPIADPSADEALRGALSKLKGNMLIGVINSISKRRDAKAVPALAKLMLGSDVEVARAAAEAEGWAAFADNAVGATSARDEQAARAMQVAPFGWPGDAGFTPPTQRTDKGHSRNGQHNHTDKGRVGIGQKPLRRQL